jgi:hypothetical protein
LKSAYAAFEEKMIPELKAENPMAANPTLDTAKNKTNDVGSTANTGFDKTMGFISGMNMFNTVLEANKNKKARQKWERENAYNTDSTYNPMIVDNPFGLYDPNTGQMKPGSKVATQDFGTTGVAKNGGQKMYRQGGTYMLTKDQIMDILAKGGEIEFI